MATGTGGSMRWRHLVVASSLMFPSSQDESTVPTRSKSAGSLIILGQRVTSSWADITCSGTFSNCVCLFWALPSCRFFTCIGNRSENISADLAGSIGNWTLTRWSICQVDGCDRDCFFLTVHVQFFASFLLWFCHSGIWRHLVLSSLSWDWIIMSLNYIPCGVTA